MVLYLMCNQERKLRGVDKADRLLFYVLFLFLREYDAQMIFGNQTLNIQLDTGSALLMVYSQNFIDQYQVSEGDESVRAAPFDASNATVLKNFTCGGQECVYAYGDGSNYTFDFVQDSVSLGGLTSE